MEFESLVQIEPTKPRPKKMVAGLGCSACPAKKTWKKGINPVFGKVRGKKLFIIAQNPGYNENKEEKELVGASGEWLWKEMKKVGLRRKDCDIQYAVRCMTVDGKDEEGRWKARTPDKEEIACCSKYTARAIRRSNAKIYIIFGELAARQVCGREFKKKQRIFWSDTLGAKVYCLDHPAFFFRGGSTSRLTAFRVSLAAAAAEVTGKHKGDPRYAALEKQDYQWITTIEEAEEEARLIRRAGAKGIRVSFDSEDDYLEEYKTRMPLNMSTCFKPGRSRIFGLYHPELKMKDSTRRKILGIVAGLLNDPKIPKVLHHGVSDDNVSRRDFGVKIRGFHFDTEYSTFFKDPSRKGFGLKGIADIDYPEFSGYASIIIPWAIPAVPEDATEEFKKQVIATSKKSQQDQYNWYRSRGMLRYSQIPLKQLGLYAGADADLCKRQEIRTKNVSLPLLDVYVDSAWVLNRMELNGPVFDFEHHKKLTQIYPPRLKKVKKQIAKIAGPDFNPASGIQVNHYVYKVLKLEYPFPLKRGEKINAAKAALEFLGRTNKFCKLVALFRKLSKMVSTYLVSFEKCAIANYGRLRTKWWLTGTRTGRLSSGGTKGESVDTVINLQNVHGDEQLQNQAVADKAWRECYDYAIEKMYKVVGSKLMIKVAKYADNPAKLYDTRDDDTGKVTRAGIISKVKAKLKREAWQNYAERIILKYGNTRIFLGFDFGQIEVRVLAQLSGDKNLIKDCKSGDIHSKVGHTMTGWAIEKIKKDKKTRTLTKNIHFGIMYGLNPDGVYNFILAKDPDITVTREEVHKMYEAYFRRYPGVKRLTEVLRRMAEEKGYVENMFGFRRPLDTNQNNDENDEETGGGGAYWGNQAINTPIQGAAHHLMLMAVAALRKKKKKYLKLLGIPTMEVHDALYFFVKLKHMIKAFILGKELLEKEPLELVAKKFPKIEWDMPIIVEGKSGFRLGDTVENEGLTESAALAEMVLETYVKECVLDIELAKAA